MKKLLLFVGIGLLKTLCFAQTVTVVDSMDQSYHEQIDHLFEFTDLSLVPNGILQEYGIPFQDLSLFDGSANNPTRASLTNFSLAYASLYDMAIYDSVRLPDPGAYMDLTDNWEPGEPVDLVGIFEQYYTIDTNALDSNWFYLSGGQLYDVLPRTNPYIAHDLFIVAPVRERVRASALTFRFDFEKLFGHTGKTIDSCWINTDDGQGDVLIASNEVLESASATEGVRNIRIRIRFGDGTIVAGEFGVYFELENTAYIQFPDFSKTISATEPYLDETTTAKVFVNYACGHTSIQKPFIWLEGYNPKVGNLDLELFYNDAIDRLGYLSATIGSKSLIDYLDQEGYDLIIVDYEDGGDYIQRNAYAFEEVLRWVNAEKHKNGSHEKNVVMGQSMGGMIARYALRRMEVNGEDHETETYISFDTGHLGDNVPLGAQYALKHIANIENRFGNRLKYFVGILRDALDLVQLPASRQMLIYQPAQTFAGDHWTQENGYNSLHEQYYNEQNNILGMPQNCEILCIANGSGKGTAGKQNFVDSDFLLKSSINTDLINSNALIQMDALQQVVTIAGQMWLSFSGSKVQSNIQIISVPESPPSPYVIYNADISIRLFNLQYVLSKTHVKVGSTVGLDSAPGGFVGETPINLALSGFVSFIEPETFKLNAWSFTPTVSTLNYYGGDPNNYTEIIDQNHNFENMAYILQNNILRDVDNYSMVTVPRPYGTSTYYNGSPHTFFNSENAPFMVYHLIGTDDLATMTSLSYDSYNFGKFGTHYTMNCATSAPRRTGSKIDHSITVENFSGLGVNAFAGIGYDLTPTGDFSVNEISHFSVDVDNSCGETDAIEISVKNFSQLRLGDDDGRTGEMHVYDGHTIRIDGTSSLVINEGSTFTLKYGSRLILEDGAAIVLHDKAHLIIEENAIVEYGVGCQIISQGPDNEIRIAGQIQVAAGADFTIDLSSSTTSGTIVFEGWYNAFQLGTGASLTLQGKYDSDPFIEIRENALLGVSGSGNNTFLLKYCRLDLQENAKISSSIPTTLQYAKFVSPNTNQGFIATDKLTVYHSDLVNVPLVWNTLGTTGPKLSVTNSSFIQESEIDSAEDYLLSVSGRGFVIQYSEFYGSGLGCIYSENMIYSSKLSDCSLEHADSNPSGNSLIGLLDVSNVEIQCNSNTFYGLHTGLYKISGKATLRCNEFSGNTLYNIVSVNNGELNLSTDDGGGYNILETVGNASIYLSDGAMSLNNGRNYIHEGPYTIYGNTVGFCSGCSYFATRNQWNASNSLPNASYIDLEDQYGNAYVVSTNPTEALPSCGYYDDQETDPDPGGGGSTGKSMVQEPIIDFYGDSISLTEAHRLAVDQMEYPDSTGNDLIALEHFHEIFKNDLPLEDSTTSIQLHTALSQMKTALENAFSNELITPSQNQSAYEPHVQYYVNALMQFTQGSVVPENYKLRFYHELDKAHLFRLLGHSELSVEILEHIESCGLDSAEQAHLNYWKKQYLTDLAFISLPDSVDPEMILIDTSGFLTPQNQSLANVNFGADISTLFNVIYPGCNSSELAGMKKEAIGHGVLAIPNPARDQIRFIFSDEIPVSRVVIRNSDGRILYDLANSEGSRQLACDVSELASGTYFFTVFDSAENAVHGKFEVIH